MDLSLWIAPRAYVSVSKALILAASGFTMAVMGLLSGCASPGPPRSPSLAIPEVVSDLVVHRVGNTVHLQFTAPSRSTDKLPLHGDVVMGTFCRQIERKPCNTPAGVSTRIPLTVKDLSGNRSSVFWTDALPSGLTSGTPQLLAYRVEFFSASGLSAGPSEAAYTASGAPPAPITGLGAEGSRLGIVLHWDHPSPSTGDTLLQRESPALSSPETHESTPSRQKNPETRSKQTSRFASAPHQERSANPDVWLTTDSSLSASTLLDSSIQLDTPYMYRATRRATVQIGGRSIELRSTASAPVGFNLRPIYPPPVPTGVTAAGFLPDTNQKLTSPAPSFAIDLIWQPVDASGLIVSLAGYNIFRETVSREGQPTGDRQPQNTTPVPVPAFHDATAIPAQRYRYFVTAVDSQGNQSAPASVVVGPSASH